MSSHRKVFSRPRDLALGICAPLFEVLSLALRLFKSRVSVSVLQSVTLWHCEVLQHSCMVLHASLSQWWSTFR